IGIVIALAAVIGKCLMDSGAADRIVRSFLKILGEKRAPVALMGSGFVLSMPVFFDTVFYLLVPLARSLCRRTKKNYILYVTAIATGGAITHTLVPPTPGPLLMAGNLGIDVGKMILVGIMIGLPTALVGLLVCRVMNRLMDRPMRPYSGEPEPEPLGDDQLPGLLVSLAPVLLPVLLISASTVVRTIADAEHAAQIREADVADWPRLCTTLSAADANTESPAGRVMELLPADVKPSLAAVASGQYEDQSEADVRAGLNTMLANREFYDEDAFLGVKLSAPAKKMLGKNRARLPNAEVERLNRLLLEAAFVDQIGPHFWETPRRKAANVTALFGNANLALLLSAAISMIVLVRQRGLTLKQLASTTENALMSGGVIILITAAGGAFGGMLRQCGIKDAIEDMVPAGGGDVGFIMLCLGFGVAALMKVAQGSGTVSMITTSAMLGAMGVTSTMLGFDVVYLAAAIGAGSLVGSWMNDSGFWIFARMSVLTETEVLKTWTILLSILGVVAFGFTLLAAWVSMML
ncbi:MAG: gluconate permease, partial [Candidatus Nealsonbacteria bacterium]|nr:gluconate permease [Candidatus Nealsonbacteria bacterium]